MRKTKMDQFIYLFASHISKAEKYTHRQQIEPDKEDTMATTNKSKKNP